MDFNFDFWLQAFVRFVTGQCDTPPVPPPHMRPKEPPKPQPAAPKQEPPQTPPIAPDNDTLKPEDIYMIPRLPENGWKDPEPVERIILTKEEALAQGWRFRTKGARRAKITHYRGDAKDVVIPAQIGKYVVNEIGESAFEKAQIDSARIPETVFSIGKRCFAHSTVKKIVIAHPVREIPTEFACCCGLLSEVQLHRDIHTIGSFAFQKCVSLKQFAIHPAHSAVVEWCAFKESGLQAFSCKADSFYMYGDAFENTPLRQRYQLMMQKTGRYDYAVVLVGQKAVSLRMPAVPLSFCARSIPNQKGGLHTLDCSECPSVRFRNDSIVYTYANDFGKAEREPLKLIVPQNTGRFFFADNTDVRYANGKPYPPLLHIISEDDSETMFELYGEELPIFALHPKTENVRVKIRCDSHYSYREQQIYYQKDSVSSRVLERITFEVPLYGDKQLFAETCRSLHFVSWKQTGKQVQVYLPSADLVGERVHWYLLKAFHGYYAHWENHLFRSEIFDRMFRQQDNTGIQKKPLPPEETCYWFIGLYFQNAGVPVLKQRQKIVFAVDVLRSTPALFPNRDMYRNYLLTHKRYALRLCKELPEEYTAFLQGFYEVST